MKGASGKEHAAALAALGDRFWEAEEQAAREFFSQPRPVEEHVRWLRHQCYRELHGPGLLERHNSRVRKLIIGQINEGLPMAETREGRLEYERQLEALREEFTHYRLFADILEDLTGGPVRMAHLWEAQGPEDPKLEAVRKQVMAENERLAWVAFDFTEGGGAGIFRAGTEAKGDWVRDRIAEACKIVLADEVEHAGHGASELYEEVQSDDDWAKVRQMVTAICQQHLKVRLWMFGIPIDEEQIAGITEGRVQAAKAGG